MEVAGKRVEFAEEGKEATTSIIRLTRSEVGYCERIRRPAAPGRTERIGLVQTMADMSPSYRP